jgi:hypothetical protein
MTKTTVVRTTNWRAKALLTCIGVVCFFGCRDFGEEAGIPSHTDCPECGGAPDVGEGDLLDHEPNVGGASITGAAGVAAAAGAQASSSAGAQGSGDFAGAAPIGGAWGGAISPDSAGAPDSGPTSKCPVVLEALPGDVCALLVSGSYDHPLALSCETHVGGAQEVKWLSMTEPPVWVTNGLATTVTIDEASVVWVADHKDQVWLSRNGFWWMLGKSDCATGADVTISQRLGTHSLAVGSDAVWVVTRDAEDADGFAVQQWGDNCWDSRPGKLAQVSTYARPDGTRAIWGLTKQGNVRVWNGKSWLDLGQTGMAIGTQSIIGKDGKTIHTWDSVDGFTGEWRSCEVEGGPYTGIADNSLLLRFDGKIFRVHRP